MAISAIQSKVADPSALPFSGARRAADPFARALSAASSVSAAEKPPGAVELRRTAMLSLSEFKRSMAQMFAGAGIDTSVPLRLEVDGRGGVSVVGHHPDRAKIEELFRDNPDLGAKFQAIAQRFTELREAERPQGEKAPLIPPVFGLLVRGEDVEVAFG